MFEIYGASDIGIVRTHNEDSFLINSTVNSTGEYMENVLGDFLQQLQMG